ncbi:Probable protein phosphatase 2C 2 [Linum perenne]
MWMIQGSLAVTRRIGDSHLKEFVIVELERKALRINLDCDFLILAFDLYELTLIHTLYKSYITYKN